MYRQRITAAIVSWLSEPQVGLALTALALIALSGCASLPTPVQSEVLTRITLVDDLPPGVYGVATWVGSFCSIRLRRDTYPTCLQHEQRHCFEGAFHGNRLSSEDCYLHE